MAGWGATAHRLEADQDRLFGQACAPASKAHPQLHACVPAHMSTSKIEKSLNWGDWGLAVGPLQTTCPADERASGCSCHSQAAAASSDLTRMELHRESCHISSGAYGTNGLSSRARACSGERRPASGRSSWAICGWQPLLPAARPAPPAGTSSSLQWRNAGCKGGPSWRARPRWCRPGALPRAVLAGGCMRE